jgi:hypothetical protein
MRKYDSKTNERRKTMDATDPRIKERPIKKLLRVELTEEEKRELAEGMAEKQAELESLEDEKKAVAKDYASRIESTQGEIRRKSSIYRQGWEVRETDCVEIMDYNRAEVRIVRLDTSEVLNRRKMTQDELTLPLPVEDAA